MGGVDIGRDVHQLLSAVQIGSCGFEVYLVFALRGIGQDADLIVEDFDEATLDCEVYGATRMDVAQDAWGQFRDEGGVTGEHANIAIAAGDFDFGDGIAEEQAFGRGDFER